MMGALLRMKEVLESLSPMEQRVANFILEFPEEVISLSIEDLAAACQTSAASVVRLSKSVGYSGFKELSRVLSADLAAKKNEITYDDIRPGDDVEAILHNDCMRNMKAIEGTLLLIDVQQLEKAVSALCEAQRIDFYGVGSSGLAANDAHNKFLRINKFTLASADPHEQVLSATSLRPGDVAVFFSYSGETRDTLETLEIAKNTGATTLGITKYGKNTLAENADISLHVSSSEGMIRSGAMGSRISQLTVVDTLYTAVSSRLYDEVKPYLDKTRFTAHRKRFSGKNLEE